MTFGRLLTESLPELQLSAESHLELVSKNFERACLPVTSYGNCEGNRGEEIRIEEVSAKR